MVLHARNLTTEGHIAQNEMDTHADTCCAGANWSLLELTGEVCDVNPFLNSYQPMNEIPVARCCTVWTDQTTSTEYLLVGDQMLWFGTLLPNSLLNPNQLRAYGLDVNDNPFDTNADFGIISDEVFIPFDTTGTVVHFDSRVPTEWERTHLPIITLTGEEWNPAEEVLRPGRRSREDIEMRTIRSLTSGMTRRQINYTVSKEAKAETERYGETEIELGKISNVYNTKDFCDCLVSAVNIATTYRDDIDQWNEERKVRSIITNERHSKATPEELARKWNIGIQTAKDTLRVTTQRGIRTAIHPMTRRVRVDHLNLHRQRLRGVWYADTLLSKVKSKLGNTCANVYTQGKFTRVIPMTSRKDAGKSLVDFTDDVGIPEQLITDGATEFTGRHTEFVKEARRMRILLHTTEQGRKNAAEREMVEITNDKEKGTETLVGFWTRI